MEVRPDRTASWRIAALTLCAALLAGTAGTAVALLQRPATHATSTAQRAPAFLQTFHDGGVLVVQPHGSLAVVLTPGQSMELLVDDHADVVSTTPSVLRPLPRLACELGPLCFVRGMRYVAFVAVHPGSAVLEVSGPVCNSCNAERSQLVLVR